MNPFAVFLSNAKLAALHSEPKKIQSMAENIIVAYDRGDSACVPSKDARTEYLQSWFPKENLVAIETFRSLVLRDAGDLAPFFLLILSDLLRDYSLQEPSDLRIRRRKSAMPKLSFRQKVEIEFAKKIATLKDSFDTHGHPVASARAVVADGRNWQTVIDAGIKESTFDFALTSPPYATALPYIDTQRLSLIWIELLDPTTLRNVEATLIGSREARKFELASLTDGLSQNEAGLPDEPIEYCRLLQRHVSQQDGFRRKAVPALLYRYFSDMMQSFNTVGIAIKPGGIYALVVGTNRTTLSGTQFNIDTPRFLAQLAEHVGWSLVEYLPLETYKRFGLHAANAVQDETLVVLRHE